MSYQFTLSDIGLRLIKAYEGYAQESRFTRDGRKIIGYGQLAGDGEDNVSESEAESALKTDLSAVESMINTHVHAAMTQSQFDALCSLAYSIGPDAFMDSDILHALNRGEVIAAANGFDAWRLGNVDGNIYVVDALVRRRTAEKALFLRPTLRTVPAPHETLKAFQDDVTIQEKIAQSTKPARTVAAPTNIVSLYQKDDEASEPPAAFDEAVSDGDSIIELTDPVLDISSNTDEAAETAMESAAEDIKSPIAEAAAEVSERLDALMEDSGETKTENWPDSLVEPQSNGFTIEEDANPPQVKESENGIVIDYLDQDDSLRESIVETDFSSADQYIVPAQETGQQNLWAYITMIIFGLTAAGGGLWAHVQDSLSSMGEIGRLISSGAVAIGVLLLLMGLYYLMKHIFSRS